MLIVGDAVTQPFQRLGWADAESVQLLGEAEMSYIFISYFREDRGSIEEFLQALKRRNISFWIDEEGLEGGQLWAEKIKAKIENSDAFVVFFSKQYEIKTDSFVRQELEFALNVYRDRYAGSQWIVPIALDASPIPDLPIDRKSKISDLHVIHANGDRAKSVAQFLSTITRVLGDSSLRSAQVRVKASIIKEHLYICINDAVWCRNGWVPFEDYWSELKRSSDSNPSRPSPRFDGVTLTSNSSVSAFLPPGHMKVELFALHYAHGMREPGDGYDPSWGRLPSNTVNEVVSAHSSLLLHVQDTPVRWRWFLRREAPVWQSYYLTKIA